MRMRRRPIRSALRPAEPVEITLIAGTRNSAIGYSACARQGVAEDEEGNS